MSQDKLPFAAHAPSQRAWRRLPHSRPDLWGTTYTSRALPRLYQPCRHRGDTSLQPRRPKASSARRGAALGSPRSGDAGRGQETLRHRPGGEGDPSSSGTTAPQEAAPVPGHSCPPLLPAPRGWSPPGRHHQLPRRAPSSRPVPLSPQASAGHPRGGLTPCGSLTK